MEILLVVRILNKHVARMMIKKINFKYHQTNYGFTHYQLIDLDHRISILIFNRMNGNPVLVVETQQQQQIGAIHLS